MNTLHKCEALSSNGDVESPFPKEAAYQLEKYPDWSRVRAAAPEKQIPLILQLAREWEESSFGILYVLRVPRQGKEAARYQSEHPCNFEELELFLYSFQEYFEQDARHDLWVIGIESGRQVVYDEHNLLHIYGMDEESPKVLEKNGFTSQPIVIPSPHGHNFHAELDSFENEIFEYWEWRSFPLEPSDES